MQGVKCVTGGFIVGSFLWKPVFMETEEFNNLKEGVFAGPLALLSPEV